jgi:hypothetical protein
VVDHVFFAVGSVLNDGGQSNDEFGAAAGRAADNHGSAVVGDDAPAF